MLPEEALATLSLQVLLEHRAAQEKVGTGVGASWE
jgi:hypothetical protein